MKIRVSMPGASAAMEVEDQKAVEVFRELAGLLLGLDGQEEERPDPAAETEKIHEEVPEKEELPGMQAGEGHKGFLYLKCEHCGSARGFRPKEPISETVCRECGNKTALGELAPMYVNCECGSGFKYMTNMDEDMFDVTCLNCGNPVPIMWNAKKKVYVTVK